MDLFGILIIPCLLSTLREAWIRTSRPLPNQITSCLDFWLRPCCALIDLSERSRAKVNTLGLTVMGCAGADPVEADLLGPQSLERTLEEIDLA
ncbi:MAG: hypothetical protein ABSG91_07840 [Syntrophobacteraceae bacterium]